MKNDIKKGDILQINSTLENSEILNLSTKQTAKQTMKSMNNKEKETALLRGILKTHLFLSENEGFNLELSEKRIMTTDSGEVLKDEGGAPRYYSATERIITVKLLRGATDWLIKTRQWHIKDVNIDELLFLAAINSQNDEGLIDVFIFGKNRAAVEMPFEFIEVIPENKPSGVIDE
jgi:hypothetical protein